MGDFLQWNPTKANQLDDADYLADAMRSGGASAGIYPSDLHNKAMYQVTTMVKAIADMMTAKGYTVSDAVLADLISVLAELQTADEVETYVEGYSAKLAGLSTQKFSAADGAAGKEVVNISQFASSLDASGYKKYPDPNSPTGYFIEQWGIIAAISTDQTASITFPIAFPNAVLNITPSHIVSAADGSHEVSACSVKSDYSVTGFSLIQDTYKSSQSLYEMWTAKGY